MNHKREMVTLDLNSAGDFVVVDTAGFTKMHYQPRKTSGGTLSSVVVSVKKSMWADGANPEAYGTPETITAAEFETPTITEDVDVADTSYAVFRVDTVEGSPARASVAVYLTDEGA